MSTMKKIIVSVLLLIVFLFGTFASAADEATFNLGAFPFGTLRTTLHSMMDNLPVINKNIFVAEIPWANGVGEYNSEIYELPVRVNQHFKYNDNDLDFKIAGNSFNFYCNYDSNEKLITTGITCELDTKYLDMMEVKSLFFDNYKALGLDHDPSVKGRVDDNYYFADETIDDVSVKMSLYNLSFDLSFTRDGENWSKK